MELICLSTDATPSEAERELHEELADILRESKLIINDLQEYKGAAKEIKEVRDFKA